MANYDSKLADWFKQVEKQEQEFKARKKSDIDSPQQEHKLEDEDGQSPRNGSGAHAAARMEASAGKTSVLKLAGVDTEHAAADTSLADPASADVDTEVAAMAAADQVDAAELALPPVELGEARELFDDKELEQFDDFLSFINQMQESEPPELIFEEAAEAVETEAEREPEAPESYAAAVEPESVPEPALEQAEVDEDLSPGLQDQSVERTEPVIPAAAAPEPARPVYRIPEEQRTLDLCEEGTGEPLPVSELVKLHPQVCEESVSAAEVEQESRPAPASHAPQPAAPAAEVQAGWDRMPAHLQTLFSSPSSEVAQNSYKTFKENRSELIQRLLDPVISLEEAARILNVCPTTVRRYTNRGVLKHIRTAGNQRRFRLSDVLTFMENNSGRAKASG